MLLRPSRIRKCSESSSSSGGVIFEDGEFNDWHDAVGSDEGLEVKGDEEVGRGTFPR